ncbi:hypothetical protein U1Q18_005761 [Sarracenia purpurea var. burkii]
MEAESKGPVFGRSTNRFFPSHELIQKKKFGAVASGAAADVAGEDLLSEDSPDSAAASAVRATVPTLLQPRVVVYDGVLPSLPQRG